MTAVFASLIASACLTLVPPAHPISQERLTELMKKFDVATTTRKDMNSGKVVMYCLTINEMSELIEADSTSIAPLIAVFEDKKKPIEARRLALRILGSKLRGYYFEPNADVLRTIEKAMADADPRIRRASFSVAQYGKNNGGVNFAMSVSEKVIDQLLLGIVKSLGDKDEQVAEMAARTIQSFGRMNVGFEELLKIVEKGDDPNRGLALFALITVALENPKTLAVALKTLKNEKNPAGGAALYVIGKFGPSAKEAVPRLMEIMKAEIALMKDDIHHYYGPALAAAVALGEIGPDSKDSVPLLLELLKHGKGLGQHSVKVILAVIRIDAKVGEELMRERNLRIAEFLKSYDNK